MRSLSMNLLLVVCVVATFDIVLASLSRHNESISMKLTDENILRNEQFRRLFELENQDFRTSDLNVESFKKLWSRSFSPEFYFRELIQSAEESDAANFTCKGAIAVTLIANSDWSSRMIDASGIPATTGIFEGNLHGLGSFDACVAIEVVGQKILGIDIPDFKTRYVMATLMPHLKSTDKSIRSLARKEFIMPRHDDYGLRTNHSLVNDFILGAFLGSPRLGVCVPSLCSGKMVEDSLNIILKNVAEALNITAERLGGIRFAFSVGKNEYLGDENTAYTGGDLAALIILSVVLLCAAVGTAIDVFAPKRKDILSRIMVCFSLYTNGGKLLSTKKTDGTIDCVNGIRFLSMSWVVVGHTWYVANFMPWNNPFDVLDIYNDGAMMMIFGATNAVDTFFFLSGFLMSFLMLKQLDKTKGRTQILFSYLHRYIRLTPAYGLIMLMFSTLALHVGSGPFWSFMVTQSNNCATNWWANLLYINNYIDTKNMCMGESWYLACDFQLFIIGPLMVYPMWKFPRAGVAAILSLLAASVAIPAGLTAANDWPAQQTATRLDEDWFQKFYIATYTRASPYIYGILFGYFMHHFSHINRTSGRKLPKALVAAGWVMSTVFCLTTLFGLKKHWEIDLSCLDKSCFNVSANAAFAGLGRLTWSIGVSWIVFACATGYGGIINKLLSWSFLVPLSRLTFCTYLIHLHMMFIFHFGRKDVMEFGHYLLVYFFFGHFMLTLVFAVICSLLFESPYIGLEKIIFGRGRPQKKPQSQNQANQEVSEDPMTSEQGIADSKTLTGISNPNFTQKDQDA